MVNLHKIWTAAFVGIVASNKANREGRDVTIPDLDEAHEIARELLKRVERDKEGEKVKG